MSNRETPEPEEADPFAPLHTFGSTLEYTHTAAEGVNAALQAATPEAELFMAAEEEGKYLAGLKTMPGATAGLTAAGAAIAPLSIFLGGREIVEGLHKGAAGATQVLGGIGTAGSGAATLTSLVAGAAGAPALAGAASIAAPLLGSLAAGVALGHWADEEFGLSDKMSGPSSPEKYGFVDMKPGDLRGVNERWTEKEVARLKRDRGDEGWAEQLLAEQEGRDSLVDDPRLHATARANLSMQDEAARQEQIAAAINRSQDPGLAGTIGHAQLMSLLGHYAE
jgi:hypothetical protein